MFETWIDDCEPGSECFRAGTRWTELYAANGTMCLFLLITMAILGVGSFFVLFRFIAVASFCVLTIWQFSMFIANAVYRFRTAGELCATCDADSNFVCGELKDKCVNSDWTFAGDAALIAVLWIFQTFACIGLCVCSCCMMRPHFTNNDGAANSDANVKNDRAGTAIEMENSMKTDNTANITESPLAPDSMFKDQSPVPLQGNQNAGKDTPIDPKA